MAEKRMQVCCQHKLKVFCSGPDATGKPGMRHKTKMFGVLKCIVFGCSGVAFQDCHQMARNTMSECLKAFFDAMTMDEDDLQQTHLRLPSAADAPCISALHEEKHGIPCMLLSLDCLHVL